jgi:hypothetical protein
MTTNEYHKLGQYIWRTYVPPSGQAVTVQGELLRASEKLRDECHRNGNMNWDNGHEILARYILDTLTASPNISTQSKIQLGADIDRILDFEHLYTEDDLFDRVERLILDWCRIHRDPVPRDINPNLHR